MPYSVCVYMMHVPEVQGLYCDMQLVRVLLVVQGHTMMTRYVCFQVGSTELWYGCGWLWCGWLMQGCWDFLLHCLACSSFTCTCPVGYKEVLD